MNDLVSLIALSLFVAYAMRVRNLRFGVNPLTFCMQHGVAAFACLWSAHLRHTDGFDVLQLLCPVWAGLYLKRSHETYRLEKTRPAPLDGPIFRMFH